MKAVIVMFDSLNRHMLPPYGCDDVHAPNFSRLANHTATFDASYVCSMPCMPARRDFHTGRPHFLHRDWGPLEPFDDSVPAILTENGVYTHLVTDHYHYFEDGGATYHNRYSSWDVVRGQEFDAWTGQVRPPDMPDALGAMKDNTSEMMRRHLNNRKRMRNEEDLPQAKTFRAGIDFLRDNAHEDSWLLQIETFDPHEPFLSHRKYKDLYPDNHEGPEFYWPKYDKVSETQDEFEHCRNEYKALLSMCDAHLGDVLDVFDELNLWDDTMLIVWTDHGFLLGEHGWWAKVVMPWYDELARTPFFVWDPRTKVQGERRSALVQPAIDLGPTLLDYFGLNAAQDMLGKNLGPVIENDIPLRDAAIFGIFGSAVNVTDGRYVYMRSDAKHESQLYEYTVMPTYMTRRFPLQPLAGAQLSEPLSFTKGCRILRLPVSGPRFPADAEGGIPEADQTRLYDLATDPHQAAPITDKVIETRMTGLLIDLMKQCDAPREQYERLGLRLPD
ncbi:MAG: sulfatase [Capsulimonadaceae bacterium]|nr:sulfatase [Capsulimonadaceae bacterium]